MTNEMLQLARNNAREAGAANVEFLKGHMEAIPLPDAVIDVGITNVVADDHLTPVDRAARGQHVGCIARALTFTEYRDHLATVGFTDITITRTHQLTDGMHSAIIQATKQAAP